MTFNIKYARFIHMIYVFITILILDQITKLLVSTFLLPYEVIPVCPFFNLVLLYNKGVSFSFLWGETIWHQWLLIGLACTICLVLWNIFKKEKNKINRLALVCIISGALGNVIDRIRINKVIDFLDFYIYPYHWPAFNVADIAISCGAIILFFNSFMLQRRKNV